GSIAIHVINVDFVERLGSGSNPEASLPFHKAVKKIPYCAPDRSIVRPDKPNGVKFEMFVFDALPFARHPILIETLRSEDFSPVKNAEGVDSPESCRKDQLRMAASWLKDAGVNLKTDDSGLPETVIEIDPAFAMDRETFLSEWARLSPKPAIRDGLIISG
ncbi:MAG TPA: UDPGP type 1 family protein, partial [Opitutales bacterium]|nr:UDPGP type 1 family protein [Opitutales bacterium]